MQRALARETLKMPVFCLCLLPTIWSTNRSTAHRGEQHQRRG